MSKKAVLVVSYGTSYDCTRENTIGAVERAIAAAYPDREVRRAFTARMVIDILKKRDIHVDFVKDALEKLVQEGFDDVIVQSTHIMNGGQFDYITESVREYKGKFDVLALGSPLLTTVEDYDIAVKTVISEFLPQEKNSALLLMGHGTVHYANATYSQLQMKFWTSGYENVFVTTVEGYPDFDNTVEMMRDKGFKSVRIVPLMVVAGDHATNDLAGDDEDSLKNIMKREGYEVECIVKGLGENAAFQKLFVEHAFAAKPL